MGPDHSDHLDSNHQRKVAMIDYREPIYEQLKNKDSEQAWNEASDATTHGMSYSQFLSVYENYAQVLGISLRYKGENIGCLTLEVQWSDEQEEVIDNPDLHQILVELAKDLAKLFYGDEGRHGTI